MAACRICGKESPLISSGPEICRDCILNRFEKAKPHLEKKHEQIRQLYSLTPKAPKNPRGISCNLCARECQIADGEYGYCGIRTNKRGKLIGGTSKEAYAHAYHESLPGKCAASWVCAREIGKGYPEYSSAQDSPETDSKSLHVFYYSCSLNCLGCQHRSRLDAVRTLDRMTSDEIVEMIDNTTNCIMFTGGEPSTQIVHALKIAEVGLARKKNADEILRICWETNGLVEPHILSLMINLSAKTGGIVKFDIKFWNENLSEAVCGFSNERILENFRRAARSAKRRKEPPLIVASTPLIPGYVTVDEIAEIAKFIASVDPETPYALIPFDPQFRMKDLPKTSKPEAEKSKKAALRVGLENVKIVNEGLLVPG